MKSLSFVHIISFFIPMAAGQFAVAQDYVVTAKGDTLHGKVKPLTYGPDKKVVVKDASGKKTTLSIFQTKAHFIDGETFNPVKTEKGYVFMKLVKPGYLSLYTFQPENQNAFDAYYLLKKDGNGIEVPNLSFKKIVAKFLADDVVLSEKLEKGDYGKKQLTEIIDEYNQHISQKSTIQKESITVQREKSKDLVNWQILEDKVKLKGTFDGKEDVLEMINDVKTKIKNSEKIPNFLIEGLRNSLSQTEFKDDLENALKAD